MTVAPREHIHGFRRGVSSTFSNTEETSAWEPRNVRPPHGLWVSTTCLTVTGVAGDPTPSRCILSWCCEGEAARWSSLPMLSGGAFTYTTVARAPNTRPRIALGCAGPRRLVPEEGRFGVTNSGLRHQAMERATASS